MARSVECYLCKTIKSQKEAYLWGTLSCETGEEIWFCPKDGASIVDLVLSITYPHDPSPELRGIVLPTPLPTPHGRFRGWTGTTNDPSKRLYVYRRLDREAFLRVLEILTQPT